MTPSTPTWLAGSPPAEAGAALYRIAREAVANAARHSGCSAIEILLQSFGSGPGLEVRDNGKGFDVTDAAFRERGAGLVVMEYCAARAGIDLRIVSSPVNGTVVQARCPTVEKVSAG